MDNAINNNCSEENNSTVNMETGCLLRTTQRSESSNSYFKRFESQFGTLVEFWMRYNSVIEQQRHSQRRLDTANEHSMLEKVGPMKVEMHVSLVYTHPIFADFQNEVKHAICSIGVRNLTTVGTVEYHDVRDGLKHRNFRVEFNTKTNESKCACKLFERHGIVCRHILWVWNGRQVHRIPEPYVLARWTKKSYGPIVRDKNGKVIEDIDEADIKKAEMSKKIEALLGITASNDIDLRPPNKANNKGSGKRLRSSKEKAKSKPQKRKRRCEKTLHLLCKRMSEKYYIEVDISISRQLDTDSKAMELMEGYKNPFQDESVEVEKPLSMDRSAWNIERIE
ncbi:protein FAR1-RELATED SEQUENCE 5-like [Silene latifolia]|uniref:protein FAR1-RELATED SEQUENCE 5-like n=1 Tax=Silene latifolia TaxID=37657 RepID=UPI003D780F96